MKETSAMRCTWLGLALAPLGMMAVLSGVVMLCVTERHAVTVWKKANRAKEEITFVDAKSSTAAESEGLFIGVDSAHVLTKGAVLPTKPGILSVYYQQYAEEYDSTKGEWTHTHTKIHVEKLRVGGVPWVLDCDDFSKGTCPLQSPENTFTFTQYLTESKRYTYTYAPRPRTVSFAAKQRTGDAHLVPWENPVDGSPLILYKPDPSQGSSITSGLTGRASVAVYLLRVGGWLVVWLGMYLVLSWVADMSGTIGLLAKYCPWLTRLSTVMMVAYANAAALLTAICIAEVAWATVQPSLVIPLAFCVVIVIGVVHRTCSRRGAYTQAAGSDYIDEGLDCISTDIESICTEERRHMRPPSPPLQRAADGFAVVAPMQPDIGDISCSSMATV